MFARLIFSIVDFGGQGVKRVTLSRCGIRWQSFRKAARPANGRARRNLCVLVLAAPQLYFAGAQFHLPPGIKGEIDMVGDDGSVLAFIEVKTRTIVESTGLSQVIQPTPKDAVNCDKRRNLSRVTRQFLRTRHMESAECRYDVLATETRPGTKPCVRLYKGAFNADRN